MPKVRDERMMNPKPSNPQQLLEAKVKRSSQRPYSGGIQKIIKTETSKTRVQSFKQPSNFQLYESTKNPPSQSNS